MTSKDEAEQAQLTEYEQLRKRIIITPDEIERARLMSEYKYEVDTQSKVVHARREGMQKRSVEIARNSKKLGIPVEQIALITGLSPEEIARL